MFYDSMFGSSKQLLPYLHQTWHLGCLDFSSYILNKNRINYSVSFTVDCLYVVAYKLYKESDDHLFLIMIFAAFCIVLIVIKFQVYPWNTKKYYGSLNMHRIAMIGLAYASELTT